MSARGNRQVSRKSVIWSAAVGVAAVVTMATVALRAPRGAQAHLAAVYTREGGGGFLPASAVRHEPIPLTPLQQLDADYAAGRYAAVGAGAERLLAQQGDADPARRREAARAALLWAYTAAWKRDFPTAAERFTLARNIAASLPDHGAAPAHYGDPEPGIEEEAAFQQAVCRSAEDRVAEAEAGYRQFLRDYPQSILIHAAVKRIGRFHRGNVPADAEALWQADMKRQRQHHLAVQREQSLCAPECLAELLRRQGRRTAVHTLAAQMHTDAGGTTLLALAQTAQRHGLPARGLELTQAGLAQQKLPAVAYLTTGHYVLVDRVESAAVTVWDPDAHGPGKAAAEQISQAQWQQTWSGKVLGF